MGKKRELLHGELTNCAAWLELENPKTGGLRWSCLVHAPATQPPGATCKSPNFPKQKRVCTRTMQVQNRSDFFKKTTITRCAKYAAACQTGATLDAPVPKGDPDPIHYVNIKKDARDLAKQLAKDATAEAEEFGKALGREVMSRGGLRPYKFDKGKEEYTRNVPIFMRRKTGMPPDEMASEMGYEYDSDLYADLAKAYPSTRKTKRRFSADDFIDEAEAMIEQSYQTAALGGTQKDLFPGLRRDLTLKVQDVSTSEDPVTACMERKGWKENRMITLRESISEKLVPDLFTGKTVALSAPEKEYQREIDKCIKRMKGIAGLHNNLGYAPTAHVAEGVRKAVKENKARMTHGDTGLNAFYITQGLEIIPWKEYQRIPKNQDTTAVHSHSAENWNRLVDLTGEIEPDTWFSVQDLKNYRSHILSGRANTKALIMADGRMIILRCPGEFGYLSDKRVKTRAKLSGRWWEKPKYAGLNYSQAARKKQMESLTTFGCIWTDARWKDADEKEPQLFKPLESQEQRERLKEFAKQPSQTYTTTKSGKGLDLSKAFWINVPGWMYPSEPTQQELFEQRYITTPVGTETRITMEARERPRQLRLFGLPGSRK